VRISIRSTRGAGLAAAAVLALIPMAQAEAQTGGTSPGGTSPGGTSPGGNGSTTPGSKAKLVKGRAIAPASAPKRVQRVIAAANRIRNKPYVYGGGHGSFKDDGYDCSGSVSYALHGGGLLKAPLDSSGLAKWKRPGKGNWISVYGNAGHAYMIVAGLRFDTSMTPGDGPGWSKSMRSTPGKFAVRHMGSL
jgi:cell wall-associated NlpC family hydrolase